MAIFLIDTDNNITAFTGAEQIPEGHEHFATEKDLAKLSAEWPITRLVDVWNGFAGVVPFDALKPVKKFTDRKTATTRIWTAIQKLDEDLLRSRIHAAEAKPEGAPTEPKKLARHAATAAPKEANATKDATTPDSSPTPRPGSKTAIVLDLLRTAEGATLAEIMTATGWQSHSVRGFISGAITKKLGFAVGSTKIAGGQRTYRMAM